MCAISFASRVLQEITQSNDVSFAKKPIYYDRASLISKYENLILEANNRIFLPNSQACVLEISMPRERNVTPSCRRKNQDSTDRRTLNDFRKHGKEWSKVQGCPNKQKMWVLKFSLTKF